MNDRLPFESRSDDSPSEPIGLNRILRFEAGTSLRSVDAVPEFPITELPGVEVPHRICLPEHYEAGYSYPLIVWLHDEGCDADEVDDVLPRISERNYLGVALQGNVVCSIGRGWSSASDRLTQILSNLDDVVAGVEDRFRIHAGRMYLAGFGAGGTLAWEILLRQPKRWAGAICLSGHFPKIDHPLALFRELQQRRLLVSTGLDCPAEQVTDLINSGRLMYSAGLEVGTRMYDTGCKTPTDKMLRDVDRWVMDSIATAVR
jgi:phospholipase/carboxylesterase